MIQVISKNLELVNWIVSTVIIQRKFRKTLLRLAHAKRGKWTPLDDVVSLISSCPVQQTFQVFFSKISVCPANEIYSCGNPYCEPNCNSLGKPCNIAIFRCEDRCYCDTGFARNSTTGVCVQEKLCKKPVSG